MKISYNWLKEYVDINISPEKLAEVLTMHSFEVENIIYQGEGLDGVVVGEVLKKEKHPDADRLSLVKVDVGDFGSSISGVEAKPPKSAILEIICGAPNIEVGQKVAVALVGAKLPNGMIIEKRKVRGIESNGMVCAEDELGLGEAHEGIMILDKDLKVGTSIKKALNLDDVIFEIDILPNRAHDCLSHIGVAREVAAISEKSIKYQVSSIKRDLKENSLNIKIKDKNLCRRYSAVVVNNVEIKESPQWLKSRLESCGVRPINNIVDITNYVMLSLGQPMHAFDGDKLSKTKPKKELSSEASELSSFLGANIIVRLAKKGENILALDDKVYKLNENDLIIADEEKPIAIAGVMGGKGTAVDENTKNIIFESANFQGAGIRKTSQRLKLASESSYRFEREIDPEMTTQAIEMALKLTKELAGGSTAENIIDIYPKPVKPREIEFDYDRVENLLGIEIKKEKLIKILNSLGFIVSFSTDASEGSRLPEEEKDKLKVKIPTHRIDIEKVNDIIEEIGRIYGYENIPEIPAVIEMKSVVQNKNLILEKDLRNIMQGLGWTEAYNYSFTGAKDIKNIGLKIEDHLELENPLSEEHQFMRTSLLSGLLKNASLNLKYKNRFDVFEAGRVYLRSNNKLPDEQKVLAGVSVDKEAKGSLFYKTKGQLQILFNKLGINVDYREVEKSEPFWHKGRSAEILRGNKLIGRIGEIHPIISGVFGIEPRVLYFEIYQESLSDFYDKEKKYKQINKFPEVKLDLSIVFNGDVKWGDIKKAILEVDNKLIKSVEPFDIYRGKNLGENKKSIAFRISYQAEDRTLKDEEVVVVQEKIIKVLEKLGGEVRK